ncbi:MAG: hypothetical protein CSA42_01335 [Gammaproteobacteria bacterium]|nr:MAG: hypothetical protein CSA42_01335 [Gammaproteobacteria bacterium]
MLILLFLSFITSIWAIRHQSIAVYNFVCNEFANIILTSAFGFFLKGITLTEKKITQIYKGMLPFMEIQVFVLMLIAIFKEVSGMILLL